MKSVFWLALIGSLPAIAVILAGLAGLATPPWELPVVATAIVIVPAAASLLLVLRYRVRAPEEKVAFILVGTFLRMGCALLGGIWAFYASAAIRENALLFAGWGLTLYLATLVLETVLGMRLIEPAPGPKPTGPVL